MTKVLIFTAFIFSSFTVKLYAQPYTVTSPDNRISVSVDVKESTYYSVVFYGENIIRPSKINMVIDGKELGSDAKVLKIMRHSTTNTLKPVIPRKFGEITDEYNELSIHFKGNYMLTFRVYDDGVAYRWETRMKNPVRVNSELAAFVFAGDHKIWFPQEESMHSHQERDYKYIALSEIKEDMFCSTATLIDLGNGNKVLLSEAELNDYPGMFLKGFGSYGLQGKFAPYPLKTEQTNDRNVRVTEYADYLAETTGTRTFPWRVMVLSMDDAQLIESELIYKLSNPLALDDVSWIKPGKVAWDWWNYNNIYGVDFRAGVNTET